MLSTLHPDRSFPTANPFPNPFRHTAQSLPVCQSMYVLFFRLQHVEASTQIRIFFVAWFRCVASSQPKTFPATVASPTAAKSEARERERESCVLFRLISSDKSPGRALSYPVNTAGEIDLTEHPTHSNHRSGASNS